GHAVARANKVGVSNARILAIKADILENLSNSELTETAVALRHRVTPRYIRMLFEAEGTTFSKFVLGHRLVHARCMLSDPRFAGKSITAIALTAGFSDLSYFDRTFRRRFQASPSEARTTFVGGQNFIGLNLISFNLIWITDSDSIALGIEWIRMSGLGG